MCKRIKFAYKLIHSNYENWKIAVGTGQSPYIKDVEKPFFILLLVFKNLNLRNMPEFYANVISAIRAYTYMQSKTKLNGMDAILNESTYNPETLISPIEMFHYG